ncbi:MAG: hypothetical protein GY855_04535 [candidate division Zixibacteria bacterium]|nr:hypothetical protein [candidate division Zixibacteria bacterium]
MKLILRISFLFALLLIVTGCGTIQTLTPRGQEELSNGTKYKGLNCRTIPRIYSGISLNACLIQNVTDPETPDIKSFQFSPYAEYPLCFFFDTLVLPYTIFTQLKHGSIVINVWGPERTGSDLES